MRPVSRDVMAAEARAAIGRHDDDWDSLHQFVTLHAEDGKLVPGLVALIDPAVHPADYGKTFRALAADWIREHPARLPYAYLLQAEGWGVLGLPPDATSEERDRLRRDRANRTYRKRADAIETVEVLLADIHGRLWQAQKRRGEQEISERFFPPGAGSIGGHIVEDLLDLAVSTGARLRGYSLQACSGPPDSSLEA